MATWKSHVIVQEKERERESWLDQLPLAISSSCLLDNIHLRYSSGFWSCCSGPNRKTTRWFAPPADSATESIDSWINRKRHCLFLFIKLPSFLCTFFAPTLWPPKSGRTVKTKPNYDPAKPNLIQMSINIIIIELRDGIFRMRAFRRSR